MRIMPLILSLLLSVKTNAATEPITILKKLQPAPYAGVLMSESKFRFYVNTQDSCVFTQISRALLIYQKLFIPYLKKASSLFNSLFTTRAPS